MYLITYQFCTPLSALLTPPSWKDGGQKQFFVNTFLNIYFRGKRFYINVILETIFYKICSTYFFVCCSVLMLKVHKDFRNGVHENNHGIKTMQYTQKVYRTFYVENVIQNNVYFGTFACKIIIKRDITKQSFWPPFFQDGGQSRADRGVQN